MRPLKKKLLQRETITDDNLLMIEIFNMSEKFTVDLFRDKTQDFYVLENGYQLSPEKIRLLPRTRVLVRSSFWAAYYQGSTELATCLLKIMGNDIGKNRELPSIPSVVRGSASHLD